MAEAENELTVRTEDNVEPSPVQVGGGGSSVPGVERYEIAGYHQETPLALHEPRGVKRTAAEANAAAASLAKKKRLCRYPGCVRVIKSQGHCQRHGARAKRCKVEGCEKQAQGTHEGMCKRHWKLKNFPEEATKKGSTPPEPEASRNLPSCALLATYFLRFLFCRAKVCTTRYCR